MQIIASKLLSCLCASSLWVFFLSLTLSSFKLRHTPCVGISVSFLFFSSNHLYTPFEPSHPCCSLYAYNYCRYPSISHIFPSHSLSICQNCCLYAFSDGFIFSETILSSLEKLACYNFPSLLVTFRPDQGFL